MAVTEGDLFCYKQMTPNKNLRAANPKIRKRGEPEKSSKSKRSGAGAMTLIKVKVKVEDPLLVLTTLNEEWANKMQNIEEMLNYKKEGGGGTSSSKRIPISLNQTFTGCSLPFSAMFCYLTTVLLTSKEKKHT